jgi:hypothetical protein
VYLYGHILTPGSRFGHKHVVSQKRLDSVKFRKIIKLAMLVDFYNSGVIEFEIRRGKLGGKQLIVKRLRQIDPFDVTLEKQFAAIINERGEIKLEFHITNVLPLGFEQRVYMDRFAEVMNRELAAKGYLTEDNGRYLPVQQTIKPLEAEVESIKKQIDVFRIKKIELIEFIEKKL